MITKFPSSRLLLACAAAVFTPWASASLAAPDGTVIDTDSTAFTLSVMRESGADSASTMSFVPAPSLGRLEPLLGEPLNVTLTAGLANRKWAAGVGSGMLQPQAIDLHTFHIGLWNLFIHKSANAAAPSTPGLFGFAEAQFASIQLEPVIAPVPLPPAIWLFASGLAWIGRSRARRQTVIGDRHTAC